MGDKVKLTDGLVKALPVTGRDTYVWDAELKRFGLRVTPKGAKVFVVRYRTTAGGTGSVSRRVTIGEFDSVTWNVTKARAAAAKLLAPVVQGVDPFADREAKREAARQAKAAAEEREAARSREADRQARETVRVLLDTYAERRLAKRRSGAEAERLLKRDVIPALGDQHIAQVRRADVIDLIERVADRAPVVARQVFAELRTFMEWCAERELITVNPCARVTPPARPDARDRVLTEDELRIIWRAADAQGFPFGTVTKLLAITGQRRKEVAGMAWAELDLEAATWSIPAERTKNGQAHEIDLAPEAVAILKKLTKSSPLVFPARGEGYVRGFSAGKRKLDALVEELRAHDAAEAGEDPPAEPATPWRLHDFRRTAASNMAALAFPPHVVERVLNHISTTNAGLVGVYQRHNYRAERRAALLAWGAQLAAVLADRPVPSNVRKLRG